MLAPLDVAPKSLLAKNLKKARQQAHLTQEEAAAKSGFSKQAISGWERGAYAPTEENLAVIARLYGTTPGVLRYAGDGDLARSITAIHIDTEGTLPDALENFQRNPLFRRRLPPKPYARVYEHIDRMLAVGATTEQIEEAERLMIDGAYNKLNARDPRDRTDDEMILDIDDAWDWIKEVLGRAGIKGL